TSNDFGPASRHDWATTHAWQPDGTAVIPPSSVTFDQLRAIDRHQREIDTVNANRNNESDFVRVRCRINGGVVELELSIEDLRSGLGLPSYRLCPPF
ncbi:TPA: hypothetical protein N0F65_003452, partial [Lagenidium giganteum]